MKLLKIVNQVCYAIFALPILYIVVFYSYVARVSLDLGRLPSYNNPDPTFMYPDHRALVIFVGDAAIWSLVVGLFIIIIYLLAFRSVRQVPWGMYVTGALALIYSIVFDPFMEWFID